MSKAATRAFQFVDQFCGGGGFSEGLRLAQLELGLVPEEHNLAVLNHWAPAIETHRANHPHAKHSKANVWRFDPREAVPQGRIDLMTSSPTCTFFSTSRGGMPVSWDQRWGRMTPWQVYRWCKELDVRVLVVENVPEIKAWGPVCNRSASCAEHPRGGKPWVCPPKSEWPKKKNGERVARVICGKRLEGYVNAEGEGCHFRRWVSRLRSLGYDLQYRVLNAADYGDATTRRRFFLIARKDGLPIEWPTPTHSQHGNADLFGGGKRPWRAAAECIDWALKGQSIFDRERPLSEKTIARILVGAKKCGWPDVFLVVLRNHMNGRPLTEGLPSICAAGNHLGLAEVVHRDAKPDNALVFQVNQGAERARNIRDAGTQPLQTVVTGDSLGVAEALVMRSDCQGGNGSNVRGAGMPVYTPTTNGGLAVVEPALLLPQGSLSPARAADDAPLPAAVAINRTGLAQALMMANRNENAPRSTAEPMPPATTAHGGGLGLVEPLVLGQHGGATARAASRQPIPTPTTDGAISLISAFITPAFGERKTQTPRTHSLKKPMPTLCAQGRLYLVQQQLRELGIDILFRMLEPKELAAAMGFPATYKWPCNKTKTTRMIGNAVAVNMAKALLLTILRSLVKTPDAKRSRKPTRPAGRVA
jgi:DNA (cytosine-5)-methyltransferase 1